MLSGTIVVLTDRPDRSHALAAAVDAVADCMTVDIRVVWSRLENVRAVLADVTLANAEVRRCLMALRASFQAVGRPPLILLTRWGSDTERDQALAHGASICIPAKGNVRSIVAAVVDQVSPDSSLADMVVTREIARAGSVLSNLMDRARLTGRVDTTEIEKGVDPVLRATREGGLGHWLEIVWKHDDATFQHSLLVAGLTASFAVGMGLSQADQRMMTRGALVHDIGKAKVPSAILNKPGELNDYEKSVVRAHPVLGYDILRASGERDSVVLGMTRHHHEMLDGSGYPDGLRGQAIADPIRMLTICDIYAALIERRAYKAPLTPDNALNVLRSLNGRLEGALIDAFARSIRSSLVTPAALPTNGRPDRARGTPTPGTPRSGPRRRG